MGNHWGLLRRLVLETPLFQMNRECSWLEGLFHEGVLRGFFMLITPVGNYNWVFCDF